jgi:hypothetical protein
MLGLCQPPQVGLRGAIVSGLKQGSGVKVQRPGKQTPEHPGRRAQELHV